MFRKLTSISGQFSVSHSYALSCDQKSVLSYLLISTLSTEHINMSNSFNLDEQVNGIIRVFQFYVALS